MIILCKIPSSSSSRISIPPLSLTEWARSKRVQIFSLPQNPIFKIGVLTILFYVIPWNSFPNLSLKVWSSFFMVTHAIGFIAGAAINHPAIIHFLIADIHTPWHIILLPSLSLAISNNNNSNSQWLSSFTMG